MKNAISPTFCAIARHSYGHCLKGSLAVAFIAAVASEAWQLYSSCSSGEMGYCVDSILNTGMDIVPSLAIATFAAGFIGIALGTHHAAASALWHKAVKPVAAALRAINHNP